MPTSKAPYRNVLRSKRLIQDAYIQLLMRQTVGKIKIKDLIELANISKGTFYAHYTCVQDIRREIEDEQLVLMFQDFERRSPDLILEDFSPLFLCGLREMERKQDLFRLLFNSYGDTSFTQRVTQLFLDHLLHSTVHGAYFDTAQQAKNCLTFVAGGTIAVIQNWLAQSSPVPAETVAQLLSDCAVGGIRGFREMADASKKA